MFNLQLTIHILRVYELEHTLAIVQTAQSWSQNCGVDGGGWSPEQAQKIKEVTLLLMQAKQVFLF
jgi:hypothetical protein